MAIEAAKIHKPIDTCETDQDQRDVLKQIHKGLQDDLRQTCKGKWIVRARCEDGTIFWNKGVWEGNWYEAHCYESEAEAQAVIVTLKNTPSDFVKGNFLAVQI